MLRRSVQYPLLHPCALQIWTPLNPASREDENLEGFKAKEAPLGRIGQVGARQESACRPCQPFGLSPHHWVRRTVGAAGLAAAPGIMVSMIGVLKHRALPLPPACSPSRPPPPTSSWPARQGSVVDCCRALHCSLAAPQDVPNGSTTTCIFGHAGTSRSLACSTLPPCRASMIWSQPLNSYNILLAGGQLHGGAMGTHVATFLPTSAHPLTLTARRRPAT